MNYQRIYDAIVGRGVARKKLPRGTAGYVYYERHHILPTCLGGSNDKTNFTLLTAEEHWVAHLLLVKIHLKNPKLIFACQAMSMTGGHNKRTTNKLFGWIRREYRDATSRRQRGKIVTQDQRDKISNTLKGRPVPHQVGDSNVSKRPEVAKKISDALKGKSNGPRTTETKSRISAGNLGHTGLSGSANPGFKGYTVATPINGGPVITMAGQKEMEEHGFLKSSVYKCLAGRNKKHRGYTFKRVTQTD